MENIKKNRYDLVQLARNVARDNEPSQKIRSVVTVLRVSLLTLPSLFFFGRFHSSYICFFCFFCFFCSCSFSCYSSLGKFQELAAAIVYTCKFCAAGTFFVSETEICSICSAGTYQSDNDQRSVTCAECPAGRYQQDAALDATNHDTLEDCLHCSAGTFFVSKTETCQNCDGGQYQHLNDAPSASCKFCAKSTEYVSPSEACTTCLTGLYQNENARANVDCKYVSTCLLLLLLVCST